jgi:hypothetical protein
MNDVEGDEEDGGLSRTAALFNLAGMTPAGSLVVLGLVLWRDRERGAGVVETSTSKSRCDPGIGKTSKCKSSSASLWFGAAIVVTSGRRVQDALRDHAILCH